MKDYFNFKLTGKELLPIWLLYLIAFIAPYITLVFKMQNIQSGDTPPMMIFPLFLLLIVLAFAIAFYIVKLTLEGIEYGDNRVVFSGKFGKFIGIVLLGLFLTIITLGIYMAWFIRNIHRFIIDNSSYKSNSLKFQGKGGKLFLILLLTIYIPLIAISFAMGRLLVDLNQNVMVAYVSQIVIMIIMIPYMYYIYKWMVNITYKGYSISWSTNFWESCGKIAIEFIIMIVTLGIYMPLGVLRLYKYFAAKTVAKSDDNKLRFGYDIDQSNDFLFIWGQILLSIVTLGIYYPWAYCKIGERILSKTYIEKN